MKIETRTFTVDVSFKMFEPGERVVFIEKRPTHLAPGVTPGRVYAVKECLAPSNIEQDDSFVFLEGEGRPFTGAFFGSQLRPANSGVVDANRIDVAQVLPSDEPMGADSSPNSRVETVVAQGVNLAATK